MSIAQGLYEGIDLGNEGAEGLITYMRTDSVRIAPEAIAEAANISQTRMDPNSFLPKPKSMLHKKAHKMPMRPSDLLT